jgi:hypothetical protein
MGSDANTVYFVFMPPGTTVTIQGAQSCQDFCGYHSVSNSGVQYAVDTYEDCSGCQFAGDLASSTTVVASHELCEMITDPQLNAWFDDTTGEEIGDICEPQIKVISTALMIPGSENELRASGPTFSVGVSPTTAVIDGTGPVQFTVTITPEAAPPPPPPVPPPPTVQNWTVQKEWSNAAGSCV